MDQPKPMVSKNSSLEELNEFHATVFEPAVRSCRTITPKASDESICKAVFENLGIKPKVAWYLSKLPLNGNGHIKEEDLV